MCVRCGTGKLAMCTDPLKHGQRNWVAEFFAAKDQDSRIAIANEINQLPPKEAERVVTLIQEVARLANGK
jgi:hypothetical protein